MINQLIIRIMEFKGTKGEWVVSNEPFTTLVTAKASNGKTISV